MFNHLIIVRDERHSVESRVHFVDLHLGLYTTSRLPGTCPRDAQLDHPRSADDTSAGWQSGCFSSRNVNIAEAR